MDWEAVVPGIVAGMTAVADADGAGSSSDFGLATGGSAWEVTRRFEALAGATDRKALVIQQATYLTNDQNVLPLIIAAIAPAFNRFQLLKFLFPIAKYVRLYTT